MRRLYALILAVLSTSVAMLAATLLAHAGGPTRIDGWLLPMELSQSGDYASIGPHMIMDNNGWLHVMWTDDSPWEPDPHYVRSIDQGTIWSNVGSIPTDHTSLQSSVAAGSGGTVHACWWEQRLDPLPFQVWYAKRSATGWTLEGTVVMTTSDIQEPSIAEASGYINVVWSNYLSKNLDLCYRRKPTSETTWEDPMIITDTAASSLHARMAADRYGDLHVVWQENISPTNEIMYISGTVEAEQTTWHAPITLTQAITPSATSPDIVVGEDGMVHTVFGVDVPNEPHTHDLYHVSFPISNTSGLSPTVIPGSRVLISLQLPTYASPALAVDPANNLHVVWNGKRGNDLWDRIYYATSQDGGATWSRVVPVSPDDAWPDGFPDVVADGELVHIVWQQGTVGTDNDVYYSHSQPFAYIFPLIFKGYQ